MKVQRVTRPAIEITLTEQEALRVAAAIEQIRETRPAKFIGDAADSGYGLLTRIQLDIDAANKGGQADETTH